jgi:hypothetical protein
LALPHPYFVQGQEQISIFQKMGLSQEISGGLIRITADQAQLEIGCSTPLLQEDFDTWGFLLTPNLWIGSLWEFCWEFQITLEAHCFRAPEIQRDNDVFLMELLEQCFNFTGTVPERQNQWRALNLCHLSLQVLFLSDIASGDGTCIRHDYHHYQGKRARPLSSKWQWPLQKPTKLDWDLWHDAMRQLSSLSTGTLDRRLHLGPWLREPHQDQPWCYDPDGGFLFQYMEVSNVWKRYCLDSPYGRRPFFTADGITAHNLLPPNVDMASVLPTASSQRVEMEGRAQLHLVQPYHPSTIEMAIIDLGREGWPLEDCNWDWAPELVQAIILGTAFGVSDGSYMPDRSKEHGTAAWIMQTEVESRKQCWGQCATSGTTREVNAYRSELHGLHTMLLALTVICRVYKLTAGCITLACDNETSVYHTDDGRLDVPPSIHHADLVQAIRRLRKELPITVRMVQVSGHQDKTVPFEHLTPFEKLNCLADYDAKLLLRTTLERLYSSNPPHAVPNHIHGEGIRCIIGGTKVTGNPRNAVADHMF